MNLVRPLAPCNLPVNRRNPVYPAWPGLQRLAVQQVEALDEHSAYAGLKTLLTAGNSKLKSIPLGERRAIIQRFAARLEASPEQIACWSRFYGVSPELLQGFIKQAGRIALNIAQASSGVEEESAGGAALVLFPANDPRNVAYFLPCVMLAGSALVGKASSREPSVVTWAAQQAIAAGYPAEALLVFSEFDGDQGAFIKHCHSCCHTTVYMGSLERGAELFGGSESAVLFCAANTYGVICDPGAVVPAMQDLASALHWPRDCVSVKNIILPKKALDEALDVLTHAWSELGGCVPIEAECAGKWACGEAVDFENYKKIIQASEIAGGGKVLRPRLFTGHYHTTPIAVVYNTRNNSAHPLLLSGPSQRLFGFMPLELEGSQLLDWADEFYATGLLPMAAAVYGAEPGSVQQRTLAHEKHLDANPIEMWHKSVWHQGIDLPQRLTANAARGSRPAAGGGGQ